MESEIDLFKKIQTDDEFAKIAFKAVENFKKLTD